MELFYRKSGSGSPLIILHGLYGSSNNWLSIGKALSDQYTVYLPDQRNHGQSPHNEIHDYPSMRADLIEFIERHELKGARIIGHSMGGKTAMFLAESHPELIGALIVIDIAPTAYTAEGPNNQAALHKKIMEGMLRVDLDRVADREDADRQLAATIESPRIRQFLLKNLYRTRDQAYRWRLNLPVLYRNLPNIMDGLDAGKYSGGEEIAGFPVLFVRGEKSGYISDDDILVIQQIFPMARVSTIPDAGHWLHAEQPALLIRTIRYFL